MVRSRHLAKTVFIFGTIIIIFDNNRGFIKTVFPESPSYRKKSFQITGLSSSIDCR